MLVDVLLSTGLLVDVLLSTGLLVEVSFSTDTSYNRLSACLSYVSVSVIVKTVMFHVCCTNLVELANKRVD